MATYNDGLVDCDGNPVPDAGSISKEEMIDLILEDKKKQCERWVESMLDQGHPIDGLVERWFEEHPMKCEDSHSAGVIPKERRNAKQA